LFVPFSDLARSLDEQVLHAMALVSDRRFTAAAAVVALLPDVDRSHVSCVVAELEREHAHNAIAALEVIQSIYCPRPRLLRLVADRDCGKLLV
jgi:hypothetical protein